MGASKWKRSHQQEVKRTKHFLFAKYLQYAAWICIQARGRAVCVGTPFLCKAIFSCTDWTEPLLLSLLLLILLLLFSRLHCEQKVQRPCTHWPRSFYYLRFSRLSRRLSFHNFTCPLTNENTNELASEKDTKHVRCTWCAPIVRRKYLYLVRRPHFVRISL